MNTIITELEMANCFEKALNENTFMMPKFDTLFREIRCKQGIPDFIGIVNDTILKTEKLSVELENISLESSSSILSLLKPKAARTLKYLITSSGFTEQTVKRTLNELLGLKLVAQNTNNSYILGDKWEEPNVEVWAFELKLSNWKRALFQTLQYKAFANRVIIVLPKNKEKIINLNIETFKKFEVGVMIFNADNNEMNLIIRPPKRKSVSRSHTIYAIGKLQQEFSKKIVNNKY